MSTQEPGPAIAIIWGWLPALLWVTIGTVFAGSPISSSEQI